MEFFAIFTLKFKKRAVKITNPESLAVTECPLDCHLKNHGRNYSILQDREFANSKQQLEAKASELRVYGYREVKNLK